jgi:hypothetical protein
MVADPTNSGATRADRARPQMKDEDRGLTGVVSLGSMSESAVALQSQYFLAEYRAVSIQD